MFKSWAALTFADTTSFSCAAFSRTHTVLTLCRLSEMELILSCTFVCTLTLKKLRVDIP